MGTLYVDTLEPEGGTTTLTVGETGQNTVIGGNTIKLNALQDAGGNAIFTSDGSGNLSSVNSGFGSALALIQTQTFTNQASVAFTSNIDSTYGEYIFRFYGLNCATDAADLTFQVNASGETGYNETLSSTIYTSEVAQDGTQRFLQYQSSYDQLGGTGYQALTIAQGNEAQECAAGELHLFSPASTTYTKQFYSNFQENHYGGRCWHAFAAGYIDVTAAITQVDFKYSGGNFDGTIKMFGMK